MSQSITDVDVVIPSYNGLPYLHDAICSVLLQTHKPNRIIVVDDGSTDGTRAALTRYQELVEVISHPTNRGGSAARNSGIVASSASFIAFLDADDFWLPSKLERQLQEFVTNPSIGLSFTSMIDCDLSLLPIASPRKMRARSCEMVFNELYYSAFPIPTPTTIVRREVFERCGYFDESMWKAQDYECWLRITMEYPISAVPEVLCLRRINPNSITNTSNPEKMLFYTYRAFDLCATAANKRGIPLPLSVHSRKRLALRRLLVRSLLGNDQEAALFYLSRLTRSETTPVVEGLTKCLFLSSRILGFAAKRVLSN